jgi:hypothetical protein
MRLRNESPAVAVARAHVEAWSNHDFDKARNFLAPDVHVTVTTTQPIMAPTDTTGADDYMDGLTKFAQIIESSTLRIIDSVGDERNALLLLTVQAALGPAVEKAALTAARLYLLDENDKIKVEQVIFFMTPT